MRKHWFHPVGLLLGEAVLTPYARNELARRRRRNKIAKQSRKRNRGR